MKSQLIFLFGLGLCYGTVFGQKDIPKYEIQDNRLLKVLTELADTINRVNNGKGFMAINFDIASSRIVYTQSSPAPDTFRFDFTERSLKVGLAFQVMPWNDVYRVPTGYTVINGVPCLIYTGIESMLMHDEDATLNKLRRKFKNRTGRIIRDQWWYVIMKRDSISIQIHHSP